MHITRVAISMVVVVAFAARGLAQNPSQPDHLAALIAPYVDGQTLIVAHADLMAFDTAGAIDVVAKMMRFSKPQRDRMQADVVPINVFTQTLPREANVHTFIVTSLMDLARVPFFLVLPIDKSS